MVYQVPMTQARTELAELVNRVVYTGEQVVLTRHGKPVVALIPAAELERLTQHDPERASGQVVPAENQPARQAAVDAPPPLRIAAEHPPSAMPCSPSDVGTSPWL